MPKSDSKSEPKPNLKPPQNWQHLLATRVSRFPLLAPVLQPLYRRDGIGLLLLFVGVFMLFAISAPRTIILEDDGLFVSAAWFAGVVHPPGYPLYTILGWLSSHLLPFGEIPWRVHLVSGFMGAVTCICIAYLVLRRTGNRPAAYLAGAVLAVSEHFWSQAIISDVYTTNTALLFLALVMAHEAVSKRDTRFWFVVAFLYGLGLANHWPLLILGSPIFIAYALASGREFWGKLHYLILSALIPAVLLYGWMIWRSHQDVLVNFLGPIDSLSEVISFIRRDIFADADSSASAGLIDKAHYARYFITEWFLQLSILGGVFALWGMLQSYRNGWRFGFYGEVVTVFTSSFLLIWMLGYDYEYLRIAVFRPYPLVTYCILALWFGIGMDTLIRVAGKWRKSSSQIIIASFSLIIIVLGIWNGRTNYRANDRFAEQLAQSLFDVVEQNAIFVVYGDASTFTASYYHLVEGKRIDISLLEKGGYFLSNRVVQPLWSKKQNYDAWFEFAKNTDQPFYSESLLSPEIQKQIGQSLVVFAYKTNENVEPGRMIIETNDSAKQFFKKMIALTETRDRWNINLRNRKIKLYGEYLGYAILIPNKMENYIEDVLPLAENNYWSLIGMTTTLLGQRSRVSIAEKYLKKAKLLADDQRSKSDVAQEFYLECLISKRKGNSRKARNLCRKSIKISSKKTNPAYKILKEL